MDETLHEYIISVLLKSDTDEDDKMAIGLIKERIRVRKKKAAAKRK